VVLWLAVIVVSDVEHLTGAQEKLHILSQTLESFIITTYPTETCMEDQEVHLLKLAHNFFPVINTSLYSLEVGMEGGVLCSLCEELKTRPVDRQDLW